MFDTIVIGFDGSDQSRDALALALSLAEPDSELVLCCVHPFQALSARVTAGEHGAASRADALERVAAGRALVGQRAHVRSVVEEVSSASSAAAGLHAVAQELGADLLVVGSTHRGLLGRIALGSTTAQVLHAPPCAVAVAPAGLQNSGPPALNEIGVGFDDRPESRPALCTAVALAARYGARVHAISVVEPVAETFGWAGAIVYPQSREDALQIAREQLDAAVAELDGAAPVVKEVTEGLAAQELVLASARLDLLVLGSRGYGPIGRVILGSVATRVAAAAASPVLVLPRTATALVGAEVESVGATA